jgi:ABC-2 type transport system ATP-binding protein
MTSHIIETDGLTRTFRVREGVRRRTVVAVDDLSLRVEAGEAVGYIGANGAGKSTTIKMLCGILVPTSGEVRTCRLRPVAERRRLAREIGVVFGQRSQLWWDLPTGESFALLAAIHRLSPADAAARREELVERLELGEFLTTPVRQLSLGQRMRAEVAAALLHRPRLVILDEPTIGLDVLSKQRLREFLVTERRDHGTTLLLTTHDMGDVERLCDRVVLVDRGRTVHGSPPPRSSPLSVPTPRCSTSRSRSRTSRTWCDASIGPAADCRAVTHARPNRHSRTPEPSTTRASDVSAMRQRPLGHAPATSRPCAADLSAGQSQWKRATHSTWCVIGKRSSARREAREYPASRRYAVSRARAAGSHAT